VRDNQTAWKEITVLFNEANPNSRRTSGNIKDKWKQMGAENAAKRRVGPWSLKEGLELLDLVCKATDANIMKGSIEVVFKEGESSKRFEVTEGEVVIYKADQVQLSEVIFLIVKPKRAKKHLKAIDLTISWKAVQEKLATRSVDDIRNFWTIKILPLFDESS
jgi:hypothetical protein